MGAGWPTLGYFTKPSGAIVVNTGCTDWACGLRRDLVVQRITMNVMRKLSVSAVCLAAGRRGGLTEALAACACRGMRRWGRAARRCERSRRRGGGVCVQKCTAISVDGQHFGEALICVKGR